MGSSITELLTLQRLRANSVARIAPAILSRLARRKVLTQGHRIWLDLLLHNFSNSAKSASALGLAASALGLAVYPGQERSRPVTGGQKIE
jgi:hypothetical protein